MITELELPFSIKPEEQEHWEREFESIDGVKRINEEDFSYIRTLLADCEDEDSYLTSANYYQFTGRNGLWVYENRGAFLFICWHPNVAGKIIIFPQLRGEAHNLIPAILEIMPLPPNGTIIARARQERSLNRDAFSNLQNITLTAHKEEVLDWQFPVHILSTSKVADTVGHEFMCIRNRLRQTHKRSVKIVPFDAVHHSRSIENLLHSWAKHNAANQLEYDALYAPYESLFSSSMNTSFGLSGLMIYIDDQLQAVGLWDVSNTKKKTANLYTNFCNVSVKGLSELLIVRACEMLRAQGIEYLNLGGSETAGLNRFKNKFHPAISLDLHSIEITTPASSVSDKLQSVRRVA